MSQPMTGGDSASSPLLPTTSDHANLTPLNPVTARDLLQWLRVNRLVDTHTIPTGVLRSAIHSAGPASDDPDKGHCAKKRRTIACLMITAIAINTLLTIVLFGVQQGHRRWRGNPLGIYAFVVSMLLFLSTLLAAVFMCGLKKGRKTAYEGNGNIALGGEESLRF
ncbi:hypothetical protein BZA05DRAFT_392336 [Tricharina praecox]|uniref:uncharacterized protein n=1 Tax=Tricharina praecox TaxID=43433 RepID=UPI00221F610E|nr:uncharacterized protein BZA05DRAFT_392336 [Tricharina praecox]KAI5854719.1 hypothetical protein BZA05DRAFT_392336 [Tricharina praecox]